MSGYAFENIANIGTSQRLAIEGMQPTAIVRCRSSRRSAALAAAIRPKPSDTEGARSSPAFVSRTPRASRTNSLRPNQLFQLADLTADGGMADMQRLARRAEKLPSRAAASNTRSAFSGGRRICDFS